MYNLMVTAGDNLWEDGAYTWHKSRILEYTTDENKEKFGSFSPAALGLLVELPTLFMYERGAEGIPKIGKIKQIKQRGDEFRVLFEFDDSMPSLTLDQIESLKWDLEIHDFEFGRTHWAVKDANLIDVVAAIKSVKMVSLEDALDKFKSDETLEELIGALHRDIRAEKHAVSLDRLHTYCMKKFAHLIEKRGGISEKGEPLHSRFGKYVKSLEQQFALNEASKKLLKNSVKVFEQFNYVRNNDSLAHDNQLLDKAEARFVFDSVTSILRFVNTLEGGFEGN